MRCVEGEERLEELKLNFVMLVLVAFIWPGMVEFVDDVDVVVRVQLTRSHALHALAPAIEIRVGILPELSCK